MYLGRKIIILANAVYDKISFIFLKKYLVQIIECNYPISITILDQTEEVLSNNESTIVQTSDPEYFENVMMAGSKWKNAGKYLFRQWAETDGWQMAGTQQGHFWCGTWQTLGCLNSKQHKSHSKKIFLRQYQRSCFRSVCRICYKKWAARQASAAAKRITKYQKASDRVARLVRLSIPNYSDASRKTAVEILKQAGCDGGAMVFSPFEQIGEDWVFNPAFYALVFGVPKITHIQSRFPDWKIEPLDEFVHENSDPLFETIFDLMLRSGVKKGFHSFVWFGNLSYRALQKHMMEYCKVIVENLPKKGHQCPICGNKLRLIYHDGSSKTIPPDIQYEGLAHKNGWFLVYGRKKPSFAAKLSKFCKINIHNLGNRLMLAQIIHS